MKSLGKRADGARLERMRASPSWSGDRFRNVHPILPNLRDPTVPMPSLKDFMCGGERRVPPGPLPSMSPLEAWAKPPQSGLRVTWLGHSTLLIEIDGVRILTDPVWGPRASPSALIGPKRFQPVPISLRQMPPGIQPPLIMRYSASTVPILQLSPKRYGAVSTTTMRFAGEHGSNPRRTVAPIIDFWYLSAELAHGAPSGIMTFAADTRALPICTNNLAANEGAVLGNGTIDGQEVHASAWTPMRFSCGTVLKIAARPMIALTSIEDLGNWDEASAVLDSRRVPLRNVARSSDTLTATTTGCRGCSLSK